MPCYERCRCSYQHAPMKTLLPLLLAACPLAGQTVSLAVTAATPLTARALAVATNDVQTRPAGPLSPSGGAVAQVISTIGESASMQLNWQTLPPGQLERLGFRCNFLGWAYGVTSPASAAMDPFELLVHVSAPAARRVMIAGSVAGGASPGTPAPQLELDLFDDGLVEWSTLVSGGPVSVLVGPTPVAIRIRGAASLPSNGLSQAEGIIEITPDNHVDILQLVQGCVGLLRFEQAFAHDGVRLSVPAGYLCVGVFGLGVQPLVLPAYAGLPCLLLPSPDVLVVIPANGYDLPIPAPVRPLVFFAQAVWIDVQGLATTPGYRASAF
jgi:hypothetical protein